MISQPRSSLEWIQGDPAKFVGQVSLGRYFTSDTADITLVGVRFAPKARTNWHSHSSGQILWVVEGEAVVVDESGLTLRGGPGDALYTPPGVQHWHGSAGVEMLHLSVTSQLVHDWGDPVDEASYEAAVKT